MSKVITASIICALLIGSSASADLLNSQLTTITVGNAIDLLRGEQNAGASQNLVVDNAQCATGMCNGFAGETFFGAIGQVGSAQGLCALVGLNQTVASIGLQSQNVGDGVAPKMQLQTLDMIAGQALGRGEGQGSANGLQTIVLYGDQNATNAAGVMNESTSVLGMQTGMVNGQPGSTALVTSTMGVTTSQEQIAM